MDSPSLVNVDHERGQAAVEALRRAKIPIRLVVWAHFPGPEEWRLVIVTPIADHEGPHTAYSRVQQALSRAGTPTLPLQRLVVIGPADPLAKLLAETVKSGGSQAAGVITVTSTASTASGTVDRVYAFDRK